MSDENYYLFTDGNQEGPFTLGEVRTRWINGRANQFTQFYTEGNGQWRPLPELTLLNVVESDSLCSCTVPEVLRQENTEPVLPRLWNPGACGWIGFLLTPVLGSILVAANWMELKRRGRALTAAFSGIAALLGMLHLPLKLYIAVVLAWWLACARPQQKYVKSVLQNKFWPLSFVLPNVVFICLIVMVAWIISLLSASYNHSITAKNMDAAQPFLRKPLGHASVSAEDVAPENRTLNSSFNQLESLPKSVALQSTTRKEDAKPPQQRDPDNKTIAPPQLASAPVLKDNQKMYERGHLSNVRSTWVRRGTSNLFDIEIENGSNSKKWHQAIISFSGDQVYALRQDGLLYVGTISNDGLHAQGIARTAFVMPDGRGYNYDWTVTSLDAPLPFKPLYAPLPKLPPRYAPPGVFYLRRPVSVPNGAGITVVLLGSEVRSIGDKGAELRVKTTSSLEFDVHKDFVTNDQSVLEADKLNNAERERVGKLEEAKFQQARIWAREILRNGVTRSAGW